jgi:hypothetical protein
MIDQNDFRDLTIATLFAFFVITTPTIASAQGSAGGAIGNDEKSLSGSRPERSVEPASRSEPEESEPRRTPSRSSSGGSGSFDGAWVVVSVGCGGTTTGAVVVSSGRIIGESIVSGRVSPSGATSAVSVGNNVTITSSGHLSGRSGAGSFRRSDGCGGRWTASKQ